MAIAGLQNVPALDPSLLRESRSSSISQHGGTEGGATSSSPSSILKMWRELEDEWIASRSRIRVGGGVQPESNDGESLSASRSPRAQDVEIGSDLVGSNETETVDSRVDDENHARSEVECEEDLDASLEQSQRFGEPERERVRKIFREWMNTGASGSSSSGPNTNISPRAQLLGQPELERVRIVREWIQMATQGRESTGINGEDQEAGVGSQIERVREGLVLDRTHAQTENSRRDIRKLCGRQALIDLLEINKQERLKELQEISERRPVRCFANRNRIQSVFRIWLLHYGRSVGNNRTSSTAESELGFLRQRQTVTELREGFLSRLDGHAHVVNNLSTGSSNNTDRLRQNEALTEVVDNYPRQNSFSGQELRSDPDVNIPGNSGSVDGDSESQEELISEVSLGNHGGEQDLLEDIREASSAENLSSSESHSVHTASLRSTDTDSRESATIELAADCDAEDTETVHSGESSITEAGASLHPVEAYESLHDQYGNDGHEEYNVVGQQSTPSPGLEDHQSEDLDLNDSTTQDESQEERQVRQNVETPPQNGSGRVPEQINQWGDASVDEPPSNYTIGNEGGEQSHVIVSVSDESRSQVETSESWLPGTSVVRTTSAERVDEHHFSDDISAHGMELRELVSRRRVSSLLSSGFRDSLDHLIQSYVERQIHHTPDDWEMHDEPLHPPFTIRDPDTGMDNGDHDREDDDEMSSELDENPDLFQSIPMPPPLPSWDHEFHDSHWSREFRRPAGTEVEMINDLRIEMARIHQRLNNMQRTLETCVDMQFELQRSVRQEVSAALNRSVRSSEAAEKVVAKAGSKWDSVRRGICCICTESNIDSLLYRCGHMCTCTNCANLLVEGKGKCPMCRAPVVEVIRAYTIQ